MKLKFPVLTAVAVALSCCTEPSEIGVDFFKDGSLTIVFSDTVSLKVSTVLSDSTITGNSGRLLTGYHDDERLGKILASSFMQIEPRRTDIDGETNVYNLDEKSTEYLRTTLVLWYDKYSYYDTTNNQTLYVHTLDDEIEAEEDGNLYNTSKTEFSRLPIGQLSFRPRPGSDDSVEINLDDRLGRSIYSKAVYGDNDLASTEKFTEDILKGLCIRPDTTTNSAVVGFGTQAELRVYYLDRSVVPTEEKHIPFFVSTVRYNQILDDRRATPLSKLTTRKESLNSKETARQAYARGGAGLFVRIEIPHLKSILVDNPRLILTEAILSFRPIKGSDEPNTALPKQLKLYAVNNRNEILADLLSTSGSEGFVTLKDDVDLDRDILYRADVSAFVESQLNTEEFNENAMLLTLVDEELTSTVNRLYIGDQSNEFEMKLELYFAGIRENY
jgi:Domain of unknown function (DUF4270)